MAQKIDYWAGSNPVLYFTLKRKSGEASAVELEVKHLVHCGRTARDRLKLPQHVALAPSSTGERRPVHGPIAFLVPQVNATCATRIEAYDIRNNAEVEPVLMFDDQEHLLITVGSDHADRNLESLAGPKSKLWSPKILGTEAWLFEEVMDHWDDIRLKMWSYSGGKRLLYMDDRLVEILPPGDLITVVKEQCDLSSLANTVIFGGSVPFLTEGPVWGSAWDFEMFDPVLQRSISHHYDVDLLWK